MDQPEMESMTTDQASAAIEALLGQDEPVKAKEEAPEVEEVDDTDVEESDESDSEDAEPEEETQEPQIESLTDLAEALEIPLAELQDKLKTKIKVNGEEIEVTLAELTQGYQKDADYRQKTSELANQRKTFQEAYQQANQRIAQEFQQLGQVMQMVEQYAIKAPDQAEMEYLRQHNPAQYLMVKNDYEEKMRGFAQLKQSAAQAYQGQTQQLLAYQEHQRSQLLQKALEDLPTRVPDWSSSKKQALDEYLTSADYGYSPEELAQIVDPRLVQLVNKAYLYDQMSKKSEATKEKVKALPKIQAPAKPAVKAKVSNLQKAKARLGKSGHINDAASAIEHLLF